MNHWYRCRVFLCLLGSGLLAGCATRPTPSAEPPAPHTLAQVESLIRVGSPDSLEQTLRFLTPLGPGHPGTEDPATDQSARTRELLGLTGQLYRFLYPERSKDSLVEQLPPGAYQGLFQAAVMGQASSLPESQETESLGATAEFFSQVLPALYLLTAPKNIPSEALTRLEALLAAAGKKDPPSVLPPFLRGIIAERQDRLTEASAFYRDSFSRDASFYPGKQRLAALMLKGEQPEQGIALLEAVHSDLPANRKATHQLAEAYLAAQKVDEAERVVAQSLLADPEDPQTLVLRARILIELGRWSQAVKPLNLALAEPATGTPMVAEAWLLKARILHEHHRNSRAALSLLQAGQEAFPQDYRFPELEGSILLQAGRSKEAVLRLERALELKPGSVTALRLLVEDAAQRSDWQGAVDYLARIPEPEQSEQDLLTAYRVHHQLGNPAEALSYAETLYRLQDHYLAIYARALYLNGDREQARSIVRQGLEEISDPGTRSQLYLLKALDTPPSEPAHENAAHRNAAHRNAAQQDSAYSEEKLKYLRAALREYPDNLEALIELSKVLISRKEYRKARIFLKQALALDPTNLVLQDQLAGVELRLNP